MKDHGRAQETVVIGARRPLVIGLCLLLLGWDAGWCSDASRCCASRAGLIGAVRNCQAFVGALLLTDRYDCYVASTAGVCLCTLASGM